MLFKVFIVSLTISLIAAQLHFSQSDTNLNRQPSKHVSQISLWNIVILIINHNYTLDLHDELFI
jgi:hypothetical protein